MEHLRCHVADLLPRIGMRRDVRCRVDGELLGGIPTARLDGSPVVVEATLERITDGIVASGRVAVRYRAECSRCLAPIDRPLVVGFSEVFEVTPLAGETYPLEHDTVDLEAPLRDVVLCELPLVPVCRPDCAGLCPGCGADRNLEPCRCAAPAGDPRWAPLAVLVSAGGGLSPASTDPEER